jgi:hypothetical protein
MKCNFVLRVFFLKYLVLYAVFELRVCSSSPKSAMDALDTRIWGWFSASARDALRMYLCPTNHFIVYSVGLVMKWQSLLT